MPTIEQAQVYNAARKNDDWLDLTPAAANALLTDAEAYIRSYPLRSELTLQEHVLLDQLICRLAAEFQKSPPQVSTRPVLKKDIKEGAGFKKEQEFYESVGDPYPYISVVIRPLLVRQSTAGGVRFSRMVRG